MVRTAGAVMVITGMLGLAWRAVGRLGERVELLRGLQGAAAYLEEELAFRFTPLPELFRHLTDSRHGPVGGFFRAVLRGLDAPGAQALRECWTRAAGETLSLLREPERQTWEELGQVLGRYDAQTQAKALALAGQRLAQAYTDALGDRQRLGRVYLALGAAGGLVTVLVLI